MDSMRRQFSSFPSHLYISITRQYLVSWSMKNNDLLILPGVTIPLSELDFRTSRSSGPGGQNVNKVESKVELLFDAANTPFLSEVQRRRLLGRLRNRLDSGGVLHLSSQVSRSQWENRENVVAEFVRLLRMALKPAKKRIKTGPSKVSKEKRLKNKRIKSEKKKLRGKRGIE